MGTHNLHEDNNNNTNNIKNNKIGTDILISITR